MTRFFLTALLIPMLFSCSEQGWNRKVRTLEQEHKSLIYKLQQEQASQEEEQALLNLEDWTSIREENFSAHNRLIYFYNEGLAQTIHAVQQSGAAQKENSGQDGMVNALIQASRCYQECFRLIYFHPKLQEFENLSQLRLNSEIVHRMISELNRQQEEQDQQEGQQQESGEDQSDQENRQNKEGSQEKGGEGQKGQNSDSTETDENSSEKSGEQEESSQAQSQSRLLQQMLEQMQQKNNKQEEQEGETQPEGSEEAGEKESISAESIQALMREEQRNEESEKSATTEGGYNVEKDW